jgi:hypothetical protein
MKKLGSTTLIACGLMVTAGLGSARSSEPNTTIALTWPWSNQLDSQINHLNRMRGHVRWQLNYYRARAKPQIRREFARVSGDIDDINANFRNRDYDQHRLGRKIERARNDLHQIEQQLHVRSHDYYAWR